MFNPSLLLRRVLLATTSLGLVLPAAAQAQEQGAPPARVGQVAQVSGNVSFNGAGSNGQWVPATLNYPVTVGDSLFAQNGAQAAIALGSSRLALNANTELQITGLNDDNFSATESQGEVFLALNDLAPGQNFTLNTPSGPVTIGEDGQYAVTAGAAGNPTSIAVLAGEASAGQTQINAGQEAYLYPNGQSQVGPVAQDDFINQALAEMAPPPPPYAPPVVAQMTGVNELSNYGTWQQSPDYGAVWYPDVGPGWAPYHEGHWAFVPPWGWTWVDAEPWGFAPFHYGRWINDDDRWGWVPAGAYSGGYAPDEQPVYAPALVGFVGLAAGVAITASILDSGSVGWVPLAPGEPYYPMYHATPGYMRRVNGFDVHGYSPDHFHPPQDFGGYANHRAAIYLPPGGMAHGDSVSHYGHAAPGANMSHGQPPGQGFQGGGEQPHAPNQGFGQQDHPFHPQQPGFQGGYQPHAPGAPQGQPFHPQQPGFQGNGEQPHAPNQGFGQQDHPFHPQQPGFQGGYQPHAPGAPQGQPFHPQQPGFQGGGEQPHAPNQGFGQQDHPFHPQNQPQPQLQQFHPQAPQFQPQNHPQPQQQPQQFQQQQFHPQQQQQQQPRPQAPEFHPQQPQPQQPHPEPQHPAPGPSGFHPDQHP